MNYSIAMLLVVMMVAVLAGVYEGARRERAEQTTIPFAQSR